MKEERKYYVKESMRFNLDSMNTKLWCLMDDIENGKYEYVEIMGKKMGWHELNAFRHEVQDLESKAYGRVTGREYGRIKAISEARNMMRYMTCLASGMSENDASYAFME